MSPTGASLAVVRRLSAAASDVYAACSEPALLMRWLAPGAGVLSSARVDLRVHGCYRIEGIDPDGIAYAIHGRYLEIETDRRLVMTWTYEGALPALLGAASKVTIALRELGSDLTELTLTHAGLDSEDAATLYPVIWTLCLDRAQTALDPRATDQDLRFPGGVLSDIYGDDQRAWQDAFARRALANRVRTAIVGSEIATDQKAFIESRDLFFLTTIDHRGYPTCSHKGGPVGVVRVIDENTLAFPSYDGNGMYLSMGNISGNPRVGLLFIDFETPHRLRVHGLATIDRNDALLAVIPGAEAIVRVAVGEVFVNCPRYIHRHVRGEPSKYVPEAGRAAPIPQWKHIDAMQDVLSAAEKAAVDAGGGAILSVDEYTDKLRKGEA